MQNKGGQLGEGPDTFSSPATQPKDRELFNAFNEGFCLVEVLLDANDKPVDYRFLDVNAAFVRQTGLKDVVGKTIREVAPGQERYWLEEYGDIVLSGDPMRLRQGAAAFGRRYDVFTFRVGGPSEHKLGLLFLDMLGRKRATESLRRKDETLRWNAAWLAAQKDAFQAAMNDAPLETSLGILIDAAVAHSDKDMRCAFYIANSDRTKLRHVTGMPEAYAKLVADCEISPESFACGLALAQGKPVITRDIMEDPRWQDWRWLAEKHDYRACTSFPVETATGKLVGSFAMYFRRPHEPTPRERELAAATTDAAAIIISRQMEIEERALAEERRQILINELNHRVKNTLATAQALVMHTLRGSKVEQEVREAVEGRIQALAMGHDILTKENWSGGNLFEIVEVALRPFRTSDGRVRIHGPPLQIKPSATLGFTMALHELATNATKYGALRDSEGRIEVNWVVDEAASCLLFCWVEIDGPPVKPPDQKGFGSRLIERVLATDLGADTRIEYRETGVVWTVHAPLDRLRPS